MEDDIFSHSFLLCLLRHRFKEGANGAANVKMDVFCGTLLLTVLWWFLPSSAMSAILQLFVTGSSVSLMTGSPKYKMSVNYFSQFELKIPVDLSKFNNSLDLAVHNSWLHCMEWTLLWSACWRNAIYSCCMNRKTWIHTTDAGVWLSGTGVQECPTDGPWLPNREIGRPVRSHNFQMVCHILGRGLKITFFFLRLDTAERWCLWISNLSPVCLWPSQLDKMKRNSWRVPRPTAVDSDGAYREAGQFFMFVQHAGHCSHCSAAFSNVCSGTQVVDQRCVG